VQSLAQQVLGYLRQHALIKPGDRVGIAVSGGADSVALLRLLLELRDELGIIPSVVHFNHKLRGLESDADQQFVAELAADHHLELHLTSGDVNALAEEKHVSIETAAHELRYGYFRQLLKNSRLNRIATGHTLDDQAETVLLRIARGAGTRGLAGIYPRFSVSGSQFSVDCSVVRPLLSVRHKELETYLCGLGQPWREDLSNRDLRHSRNRVRHRILPRLERDLNPSIRETLAETAEIARAEEEYWQTQIAGILPSAWPESNVLQVSALVTQPLALTRRIVRAGAEKLGLRLEFPQIEQVLCLVSGQKGAIVLPNGWVVVRTGNEVSFERAASNASPDYEYPLIVPGRTELLQAGTVLETMLLSAASGYNPDQLLDPSLSQQQLRVRNWRAGDRFWPAHTKEPKKIKELLQKRHVTGSQRKLWPVVLRGEEIVWVRGFPCPEHLCAASEQALLIREVPLS
jgi:tRNA(Ile)-lysidine synthase